MRDMYKWKTTAMQLQYIHSTAAQSTIAQYPGNSMEDNTVSAAGAGREKS
jgi:hypothetical protein